ncbi:hypothetical protein, partial [Amycolatopsis magusensis]
KPTIEEKKKLDIITLKLRDSFGESVVAIDKETGALVLNKDAVREAIKQKLLLSNQTASTLALQVDQTNREIGQAKQRAKALQDEAKVRADIAEDARLQVGTGAAYDKKLDEEYRARTNEKSKIDFKARQELEKAAALEEKRATLLNQLAELGFKAADVEKLFAGAVEDSTNATKDSNNVGTAGLALTSEQIKAQYELKKAILEVRAAKFEDQANDESLTQSQRNGAMEQGVTTRLQLVRLEKDFLLSNDNLLKEERAKIEIEAAEKRRQIILKSGMDLKKIEEEISKQRLEAKRHLEDLETSIIQDEFEKRRAQTQLNYQREIDDLIKQGKLTAEIEKALKARRDQENAA